MKTERVFVLNFVRAVTSPGYKLPFDIKNSPISLKNIQNFLEKASHYPHFPVLPFLFMKEILMELGYGEANIQKNTIPFLKRTGILREQEEYWFVDPDFINQVVGEVVITPKAIKKIISRKGVANETTIIAVWKYILCNKDDKDEITINPGSVKEIIEELKIAEDGFWRSIQRLTSRGFIRVERRGGESAIYRVVCNESERLLLTKKTNSKPAELEEKGVDEPVSSDADIEIVVGRNPADLACDSERERSVAGQQLMIDNIEKEVLGIFDEKLTRIDRAIDKLKTKRLTLSGLAVSLERCFRSQ